MSVFNSISVSVLIVLLVAGLMTGLSVSGIDLLNPTTSTAEANRMNVEAAHEQAVYELVERLSAAKTDAEIQKIQREQKLLDAQYEHDIQALAQDLAHRDIAFKTWMTMITFVGGAISIVIILIAVTWAVSKVAFKSNPKQTVTEATAKPASNKDEEAKKYWWERREWARDNEEWFRSVALMEARLKAATNSKSSDKDRRDNLPLAV